MEELDAPQLYGLLTSVLAVTGPVVLTKDHLNESTDLALFFATESENAVTVYVGEYEEDE